MYSACVNLVDVITDVCATGIHRLLKLKKTQSVVCSELTKQLEGSLQLGRQAEPLATRPNATVRLHREPVATLSRTTGLRTQCDDDLPPRLPPPRTTTVTDSRSPATPPTSPHDTSILFIWIYLFLYLFAFCLAQNKRTVNFQ